jgi:histidine triad (HIT) family protein
MAEDCIFCKIASGETPGDVLDHDDKVLVLRDINPQAPVHLLVVPFEHVASVAGLDDSSADLVGRMVAMANRMAVQEGVADRGYRLAINCGNEGGQSVGHLHMHLLGGRQLTGTLG